MSDGELILYQPEDGRARVQLRAADGTVWLTQADIAELFLDIGEDMAGSRRPMTMADWERQVDDYLRLLRRAVLTGGGIISRPQTDAIALGRYERFDLARRDAERVAADRDADRDLRVIEQEAARLAKAQRRADR